MHVICLSVCHIRAPCLNCSTNLDANWQVHCTMTHCVRWGPYPPRKKGKFGCQTPSRNVQFAGPMLPAGQYKRGPIPPFAKLHWSSLLLLRGNVRTFVRPFVRLSRSGSSSYGSSYTSTIVLLELACATASSESSRPRLNRISPFENP